MYIGVGSVRVSASIDIHDDTAMDCVVSSDGAIELALGGSEAYLFLTREGADKLARTLTEARQ
jgi:hypothetical protein